MSAQILQFPVANPLQRSLAGCMGACWTSYRGGAIDIEAVSRLHRHLSEHRPGRQNAASILRQLQAARTWLEQAHQAAVVAALADGESAGEDADEAACRAHDIAGALGLLSMCMDTLQPRFARMTGQEIEDAWTGLQLEQA